mgnify:FL=1
MTYEIKEYSEFKNKLMEQESSYKHSVPNYKEDLEHIQKRLEYIIDALDRAIEGGNDLHLGIVVGQTLTQLKDIARN